MTVYSSVLDMIGNTPLVDVSRLSPNPNVRILGKMEGQNPGGSVKDRIARPMILEAEADGTLTPGRDDHRAVVGQHRHRAGDDLPDPRLPPQDRAARQRVDRASPAARGVRRRDHPVARGGGLERRRAPGPGPRRRAPRVGVPLPVRQRGQPAGALPDHRPRDLARLPRDHPLRRRARHVGHAARRRARTSRSRTRTSRSWRSSRRRASRSRACARSTTATSRRCSRSGAATTCSTASRSCVPASRSSTPASWPSVGIFAGISSGAALAGAVKVAKKIESRHDRVRRVRLRLEVPLHRCLDTRPRRGRGQRREGHLLLSVPLD